MDDKKLYRNLIQNNNLVSFRVVVKETDIFVQARTGLFDAARELVLECRGYLETYIERYPEFAKTLAPWTKTGPAPKIVREMIFAGMAADVGPMAAIESGTSEEG